MLLYLSNGMKVRLAQDEIDLRFDVKAETNDVQEADRVQLWVSPRHVVAWSRKEE